MFRRPFLLVPLMLLAGACSVVDTVGNKLDDAVSRISGRNDNLYYILAQQGVAENPNALDPALKQQCHSRIENEILPVHAKPDSWHMLRDLQPMPDATRAYADRTRYTQPDPDKPEKPYTQEHVVFYMTEYVGEDALGMGGARRYVCTVEKNPNGLFLMAVGSAEGFRRATGLPILPPEGW